MRPDGKYIVDTNVPVTANLSANIDAIEDVDTARCVLRCIEAVEYMMKHGGLVMDADDEIFDEYRQNLSLDGGPGVGNKFMKWLHLNRWGFPAEDRVTLKKIEGYYADFPQSIDLESFDLSDRKFIALACTHPARPTVLQATDSKWWGWKEALAEAGVHVKFLCPGCIAHKYRQKILGEV